MQRQLVKLIGTGLFAVALLCAGETKSMAQWFGLYTSYYSPYYSSYYSPNWGGYGYGYGYYPTSYYGAYSSYYGPSYAYASYGWGGYGASSACGCCDTCGCSSCSGCCGTGGCSGGGCGTGCAAEPSNGPPTPRPDSKASGTGSQQYEEGTGSEDERWRRSQPGGSGGPPPAAGDEPSAREQQTNKVPDQTVPQKGSAAPDQSDETPPAAGDGGAGDAGKAAPNPNEAEKKGPSAFFPERSVVKSLSGYDQKLTGQSRPERTRIDIRLKMGRVAIARRPIPSNKDWEPSTAPRLVQK